MRCHSPPMHERILNPFLLFKAAPNDMFSVFMNASFHPALLKHAPRNANAAAENTEWCPATRSDDPVRSPNRTSRADSTTQRASAKKPSKHAKATAATKNPVSPHPPDDFVLVYNWDPHANHNNNITAPPALLQVHPVHTIESIQKDTDNENDFVLVDSE